MKRIVEDFTSIDIQVGELFETGARKEKGSDSSRNTFTTRQTQRSAAWSFTTRFFVVAFIYRYIYFFQFVY